MTPHCKIYYQNQMVIFPSCNTGLISDGYYKWLPRNSFNLNNFKQIMVINVIELSNLKSDLAYFSSY